MVSKLSERLGLTAASIKAFADIDSNKLQAATTRQEIKSMFACHEEILKEKRSLSRQISVLDLFKLFS
jgi:hypothetical protein